MLSLSSLAQLLYVLVGLGHWNQEEHTDKRQVRACWSSHITFSGDNLDPSDDRRPTSITTLEFTRSNLAIQSAGIALCLVGLAFAVWARRHLGRDWGQPMTFKEGQELVKTGPYRFVRHPIYAGILFAMLASTLVSPFFFIPFIFLAVYFVYSARTEQRIVWSTSQMNILSI